MRQDFGAELAWSELCQRAAVATDRGGFIVQERVSCPAAAREMATPTGTQTVACVSDYSAYSSWGLAATLPWGDVSRAAPSPIVNVSSGGGIVPVLDAEVAGRLEAARSRHEARIAPRS